MLHINHNRSISCYHLKVVNDSGLNIPLGLFTSESNIPPKYRKVCVTDTNSAAKSLAIGVVLEFVLFNFLDLEFIDHRIGMHGLIRKINPLIATLKPQSNRPSYSHTVTVIGTLRPRPVPSSLYQI